MNKLFFGVSSSLGAFGKNNGCEQAPQFLADLFSLNLTEFGLHGSDIEEHHVQIFKEAEKVFQLTEFIPVFFGGSHDITFSLFRAFLRINPDASLLVFDAHADCDEGVSVPTHEDFVRALIKQKIVAPEKVLLFGLRKIYSSEKEFLKNSRVNKIYLKQLETDAKNSEKKLFDFISQSQSLYVSFDVDVINSDLMKSTGYAPKGGLSIAQSKKFFELALTKAKAIDLVEFNPQKIKLREDLLLKRIFKNFLKNKK
jgi:arginase family enzyme